MLHKVKTDHLLNLDNSSAIQASYNPENNSVSNQNPYLFAAVFDPSLHFTTALDCGIIALTEIPALGSNTLTVSRTDVADDLGLLQRPNNSTVCSNIPRTYSSYDFQLSSTGVVDPTVCDSSKQDPGICISQLIVRYSTFLTTRMESEHKIDWVDILSEEGGILGGIQWIMWFFTIFAV